MQQALLRCCIILWINPRDEFPAGGLPERNPQQQGFISQGTVRKIRLRSLEVLTGP